MKIKAVINMRDPLQKRKLLAQIGAVSGPHEIEIKPYSPRRGNQANRFYFGCVVGAFVQFMEEQGEIWTPDQAHDLIARRCLGEREAMMPSTGEIIGTVRKETHTLSKADFSAYVERAIAWLADFGIVVPDQSIIMENRWPVTTK